MFLSETARMAQVVLPASSFAEGEGTFTNTERRIQRVRQALAPLGDSRPDWQIVCEIAKRLSARGFDFQHPSQVMEEIARLVPDYGGISYPRLEQGELCWPCPTPDHPGTPLLHTDGLPSGKAQFAPLKHGRLEPPACPLLLVTEYPLSLFGSSPPAEGLELLAGEAALEINPAQASALGLADGDIVRVTAEHGELTVKAKLSEASPVGVVRLRPFLSESSANLLTGSVADPVSGVPGLRSCPVKVERVPQGSEPSV
jgi:formate dehydrogenase major subunit/formate dehydrogenase alpha subunit